MIVGTPFESTRGSRADRCRPGAPAARGPRGGSPRPRTARRLVVAVVAAGLALTGALRADTVTLHGSAIPLRRCSITDIKLGRVYFRDQGGRRQWRELGDVSALGFAGLTELDAAERLLAGPDSRAGVRGLLRALLAARNALQESWVRVRLVQTHDSRGEFVEAVAHLAALFVLREESYWRTLQPQSPPNRPTYAAAKEALDELRRGQRELTSPDLYAAVERMLRIVEPIHDELAASHGGRPPEAGRTRSGFDMDEIRSWTEADLREPALPAPLPPPLPAPAPARADPPPVRDAAPAPPARDLRPAAPPARPAPAGPSPVAPPASRVRPPVADGPEVIDDLLSTGRSADALALCRRVAEHPGRRSLSRFLYQYGRCLEAEGRPKDAAIMLMRGALLYDASPYAATSLLETALIYRDVYRVPGAARRLAAAAAEVAGRNQQEPVAARARALLSTLAPDTGG